MTSWLGLREDMNVKPEKYLCSVSLSLFLCLTALYAVGSETV